MTAKLLYSNVDSVSISRMKVPGKMRMTSLRMEVIVEGKFAEMLCLEIKEACPSCKIGAEPIPTRRGLWGVLVQGDEQEIRALFDHWEEIVTI